MEAQKWSTGEQTGHGGIAIRDADGDVIATVYLNTISTRWNWGEETFSQPENASAIANAKLIASAPELRDELAAAKLREETARRELTEIADMLRGVGIANGSTESMVRAALLRMRSAEAEARELRETLRAYRDEAAEASYDKYHEGRGGY